MKTVGRTLGIIVTAALLSACGGGSSGSSVPASPTQTNVAPQVKGGTANATATLTLRFPAHVGHAVAGRGVTSLARRSPKYINPNAGVVFVFTQFGNTITDPSSGFGYFNPGAFAEDGSTPITVPLFSGTYTPGSLTVTEYDSSNLTNLLAFGENLGYTDALGNPQDGSFTLNAGGVVNLQMTMVMNATGIAVTTDPVSGSDATLLGAGPGFTCLLSYSDGTKFYAFATDPSGTFVLPGTASGYAGGDPNNPYPGVPGVTLQSQFFFGTGPSASKLANDPPGAYLLTIDPLNQLDVRAIFNAPNPLFSISNLKGPNQFATGQGEFGSGCG